MNKIAKRKTVGLITIHNINNFGSALQTYATFKMVEKLGYQCTVINYKYPNYSNIIIPKKQNSNFSLRNTFINPLLNFLNKRNSVHKTRIFKSFFDKNLTMTKEYSSKEELEKSLPNFDIYLTGSDQVWNPKYCGNDTTFLLSFAPNDSKKISYAASFGNNEIPNEFADIYKKLLFQYKYISVRESSGVEVLKDLTNKEAKHVLDPTLLLKSSDWNKISGSIGSRKPYILCYILSYSFNPFPFAYKLVEHIKKLTGYDVVWIEGSMKNILKRGYKNVKDVGPKEFLGLFNEASFVITSSFHGTAFSINFNKPFY